MKKSLVSIILVFLFLYIPSVYADALSMTYTPQKVMQGEPFMFQIQRTVSTSTIQKVTFAGVPVPLFVYHNTLTGLVGVDLNKKPGMYVLRLTLQNDTTLTKSVSVSRRVKIHAPLGIPKKLGGNTTQSQQQMVNTLVQENNTLANIKTAPTTLWTEKFIAPLSNIFVTDPYGYSRQTGAYSIPHKGVDFRAATGTPVMAINRGVVRVVTKYTDYGNTIVIDHGMGVMSFYLHLSQMNVNVGDVVERGQVIGLSGDTGYVLGPHLHLSIRINNVSIDPIKFLDLFQ